MGLYVEGDVPYVSNGNCNNNNGWNDWSWIIGLAVVGGIFGNGGFGFGGGNNRGNCATQGDLANGFAQNTLQRGIDDIILGQANAINYTNQGFAGLNNALTSGFAGVNNAVCTLGYQSQAGFNAIGNQLASCCCDIRQQISDCCCRVERQIDGVNYNNAKNTCDIIRAGQDNTRAILDFLTNEKIEGLRAENTALKGRISDDYQADRIINKLSPCPSPAFIVPNPNCCYNYGVTGFGYGSGCGASVL